MDELLESSSSMSSAPQVACKLNRLLKQSSHVDNLVEVAQYDPSLTARVLQVCNSPLYRGRTAISSLKEGISRLGNEKLSRVIWQVSMSGHMAEGLSAYHLAAGAIWRHSVTTAITVEELWKRASFDFDMETAFTAGLLHDIGKVLINNALPEDENAVFHEYIETLGLPIYEAESTLFGFNHADLAGKLLVKWGQEEPLISGVTYHHQPLEAKEPRFAALVYLANHCALHHEQNLVTPAENPATRF